MPGREHAEKLWANLMELGVRRLVALALIGLATIATVGAGAYYLSNSLDTLNGTFVGADANAYLNATTAGLVPLANRASSSSKSMISRTAVRPWAALVPISAMGFPR